MVSSQTVIVVLLVIIVLILLVAAFQIHSFATDFSQQLERLEARIEGALADIRDLGSVVKNAVQDVGSLVKEELPRLSVGTQQIVNALRLPLSRPPA